MTDTQRIDSVAGLRTRYRKPGRGPLAKQIDHIDGHCRDFIGRSPFVILATAGADGRCDASPKGGAPGFVEVRGPNELAIPDLAGNNRLDSFENLVANPGIGLLFLIPGLDETLRVNGTATLNAEGVARGVEVLVAVEEAYIHCAKAFRRSGLWDQPSWPSTDGMATPACMLKDHIGLDEMTGDEVAAALEEGYVATMWEAGGSDDV